MSDVINHLPVFTDGSYIKDIHAELTSSLAWENPGLKAAAQFAWAVLLRQTSQFNIASGGELKMFVFSSSCMRFGKKGFSVYLS